MGYADDLMRALLKEAQHRPLGCATHGQAGSHAPCMHWTARQLWSWGAMLLQEGCSLVPQRWLVKCRLPCAPRAGLEVGAVQLLATIACSGPGGRGGGLSGLFVLKATPGLLMGSGRPEAVCDRSSQPACPVIDARCPQHPAPPGAVVLCLLQHSMLRQAQVTGVGRWRTCAHVGWRG